MPSRAIPKVTNVHIPESDVRRAGRCAQRRATMSKTIGVSFFAIAIASSAQAQQIGDVFYIALENHNFTQPSTVPVGTPEQLFGNPAAPYLNSLVTPGNPNAAMTSYAGNYQNVSPDLHPSEPNYV
jgi:phosphatidylinositol-3-phosphatase